MEKGLLIISLIPRIFVMEVAMESVVKWNKGEKKFVNKRKLKNRKNLAIEILNTPQHFASPPFVFSQIEN